MQVPVMQWSGTLLPIFMIFFRRVTGMVLLDVYILV